MGEKVIGANCRFPQAEQDLLKMLPGLRFGNVDGDWTLKCGDLLVNLSYDRSSEGHYEIYTGSWGFYHYVNVIKSDFSLAWHLGGFPKKYSMEWPEGMSLQCTFKEDIEEVYMEDGHLVIAISQKRYRKIPVELNRSWGVKVLTWEASKLPMQIAFRVVKFEVPQDL